MRVHDLLDPAADSLLLAMKKRREREARKPTRWRWLAHLRSIGAAVVRWHLREPDWSAGAKPPSQASGPVCDSAQVAEPVLMPALEHLMEARNAAQRDGETELATVLRGLVLLYLTGNLGDFHERSAAAIKLYDSIPDEGRVH